MTSLPAEIKAMGAKQPSGTVEPLTYKPKPQGNNDVDIHVLFNGVCATDLHMLQNDWKMSRYPLIPGHEIVGKVIAIGPGVKGFAVGDVVGLGCLAQVCNGCEWCKKSHDNLCSSVKLTYFGNVEDETGVHPHHGGFGSFLRTDYHTLVHIPAGYSAAHAGPLMCAGVTVATPLHKLCDNSFNGKGKTVGIVGLGGLGHLAVQFAAKMGATVAVFSRTDDKKDYAKQLGAAKFVNSSNDEEMKAAENSLDMVLVCISGGSVNASQLLKLLRPFGVLHFVGLTETPITIHPMELMFKNLSVSASPVGSTGLLREVLKFAAEHNIQPEIEVFKHSNANAAIKKVHDNTIRFRAVLENDIA